ncbi:mucin-5AC-like, partial [Penaeus japonicus]|uniref:mucin-5AC-like n=1 Tax=Penaeus japonicus TaxID=27405 RepID=UPI001C7135C7
NITLRLLNSFRVLFATTDRLVGALGGHGADHVDLSDPAWQVVSQLLVPVAVKGFQSANLRPDDYYSRLDEGSTAPATVTPTSPPSPPPVSPTDSPVTSRVEVTTPPGETSLLSRPIPMSILESLGFSGSAQLLFEAPAGPPPELSGRPSATLTLSSEQSNFNTQLEPTVSPPEGQKEPDEETQKNNEEEDVHIAIPVHNSAENAGIPDYSVTVTKNTIDMTTDSAGVLTSDTTKPYGYISAQNADSDVSANNDNISTEVPDAIPSDGSNIYVETTTDDTLTTSADTDYNYLMNEHNNATNIASEYTDTPNIATEYTITPNAITEYTNTPTIINEYTNAPDISTEYTNALDIASEYTNAPSTASEYTSTTSTVTEYTNAPNIATEYTDAPSTVTEYTNAPSTASEYTNAPNIVTEYTNAPSTVTEYNSTNSTVNEYTNAPNIATEYTDAPSTVTEYTNAPSTVTEYTSTTSTVNEYTNAPNIVTEYTDAPSTASEYTNAPDIATEYTNALSTTSEYTSTTSTVTEYTNAPNTDTEYTDAPNKGSEYTYAPPLAIENIDLPNIATVYTDIPSVIKPSFAFPKTTITHRDIFTDYISTPSTFTDEITPTNTYTDYNDVNTDNDNTPYDVTTDYDNTPYDVTNVYDNTPYDITTVMSADISKDMTTDTPHLINSQTNKVTESSDPVTEPFSVITEVPNLATRSTTILSDYDRTPEEGSYSVNSENESTTELTTAFTTLVTSENTETTADYFIITTTDLNISSNYSEIASVPQESFDLDTDIFGVTDGSDISENYDVNSTYEMEAEIFDRTTHWDDKTTKIYDSNIDYDVTTENPELATEGPSDGAENPITNIVITTDTTGTMVTTTDKTVDNKVTENDESIDNTVIAIAKLPGNINTNRTTMIPNNIEMTIKDTNLSSGTPNYTSEVTAVSQQFNQSISYANEGNRSPSEPSGSSAEVTTRRGQTHESTQGEAMRLDSSSRPSNNSAVSPDDSPSLTSMDQEDSAFGQPEEEEEESLFNGILTPPPSTERINSDVFPNLFFPGNPPDSNAPAKGTIVDLFDIRNPLRPAIRPPFPDLFGLDGPLLRPDLQLVSCDDGSKECIYWARGGGCVCSPGRARRQCEWQMYVKETCPRSCGLCP